MPRWNLTNGQIIVVILVFMLVCGIAYGYWADQRNGGEYGT